MYAADGLSADPKQLKAFCTCCADTEVAALSRLAETVAAW